MKTGNRSLFGALSAVLVSAALFVTGCSAPSSDNASKDSKITFQDEVGREISFDKPVEKVVVANRYNAELIRAMGKIDHVVSVDTNTAQDRAYWPQFDPANVIGKSQSDLNIEKIIELSPDALVIPRNSNYEDYAKKLDSSGIKVVVVTGWDNKDLPKQMSVLGDLFEDKAGADKVSSYFNKTISDIQSRVGNVEHKKSVYWEYGDPFTTAFPDTSNDGWHNMIVSAGGRNIFGDQPPVGDKVDPEFILKENPDLILKTTSGGALKNTGVYTPPAATEFPAIVAEMEARPGWDQLKAVKDHDLYCMTGFLGGGLGKAIGSVYLAKWLYPEQMSDINPDDYFNEWLKMQDAKPVSGHTYRAT